MTDTSEIYLDNAASTEPYPEVIEAVAATMRETYGNPSSPHQKGAAAKAMLEASRQTVADALGALPEEVFFTSGGTEANNLAITGACLAHKDQKGQIITSSLEHPSVTKTIRGLKRDGWDASYIDVQRGRLDLEQMARAVQASTILISMMYVQNELGYIYPLNEIVGIRDHRAERALLHIDAVQAFGKLDVRPHALGAELLSISAHKIGGPKGIGALFASAGTKMFTTAFGGGQERGLRSGTEALPLIVGFAKAVEITMANRETLGRQVALLNLRLRELLQAEFKAVQINSRTDGSPYILNFTLPGLDNKKALGLLSQMGIYVGTAAACESNRHTVPEGQWRDKHPLVLELAGYPKKDTRSTFRVSFFANNHPEDADALVGGLKAAAEGLGVAL